MLAVVLHFIPLTEVVNRLGFDPPPQRGDSYNFLVVSVVALTPSLSFPHAATFDPSDNRGRKSTYKGGDWSTPPPREVS